MILQTPYIKLFVEDHIAHLVLENSHCRENRLSLAMMEDLDGALDRLLSLSDSIIDLVIVRSGKVNWFANSGSIEEILAFEDLESWLEWAKRGQRIIQKVGSIGEKIPTIALIEGSCLGSGFELALACRYRVAVEKTETQIGWPEIRKGFLPVFGGITELVQKFSTTQVNACLFEQQVMNVWQAKSLQLIDSLFHADMARIERQHWLDFLQDHPLSFSWLNKISKDTGKVLKNLGEWQSFLVNLSENLSENLFLRRLPRLFRNKYLNDRSIEPISPYLFLYNEMRQIIRSANVSKHDGLFQELKSLQGIISSGILSLNSIGKESEEKIVDKEALLQRRSLDQSSTQINVQITRPIPIIPEKFLVVGHSELASVMVEYLLRQGKEIQYLTIEGDSQETEKKIQADLAGKFQNQGISGSGQEVMLRRIHFTQDWSVVKEYPLIFDATSEFLRTKNEILRRLDQNCLPRTMILSLGQKISLADLRRFTSRPQQLYRMFPVTTLPGGIVLEFADLINEIPQNIYHFHQTEILRSWFTGLDMEWLPVPDRVGSCLHYLLLSYLSEAVQLVIDGIPPEWIDDSLRQFGFAQGPFRWIDEQSLNRIAQFAKQYQTIHENNEFRQLSFLRMIEMGWTGKSSGMGFYRYIQGKPKRNLLCRLVMWKDGGEEENSEYVFNSKRTLQEGVQRILLRVINATSESLIRGYGLNVDQADYLGRILLGWSPLLGGPLRYADRLGLSVVIDKLNYGASEISNRFEPSLELLRRNKIGLSFFSKTSNYSDQLQGTINHTPLRKVS